MTDPDKPAIDEAIRAKAAELAGMVAVQDAGIVSRTLIEKSAGTVTLFAFDAGQSLSEHTAPFDALVQVLEGRMEITLSGEPVEVAAGAAVVMPANEPHALKAVEKTKMLLVMIRS
jgi:quercetin dioxygenase-like cupin family protein